MGYVKNGGFERLNPVGVEESGILTVFPWPGRCASFYAGYENDSPAIHSGRKGVRGGSRVINVWLRFKSGGGNTLIDIPLVAQSSLLIIPSEIMELAMSNGLDQGVEPPYAPQVNTVEIRAPLGVVPFLYSWVLRYE